MTRSPMLPAVMVTLAACSGGEAPSSKDSADSGEDSDCVDTSDMSSWYADTDGDGFGDPDVVTTACEAPDGTVADGTDCDDTDSSVNPAADELCATEGVDDDCDGETDEDDSVDAGTWHVDADGDGYGDPASAYTACTSDDIADSSDCDDDDETVHPGADEWCDGIDNDCDGETDEADALDPSTWYDDADHDGYGDADSTSVSCEPGEWQVADDTDCDDTEPTVYPGAPPICDDLDNDCDDTVDGGWRVPSDHADIQSAIDAASGGETICVEAGTYPETIDFSGKSVRLVGTHGASETVIDGGGVGPVVRFDSGEGSGSELVGFTITGGDATEGAGVYVYGSSPSLEELVIEGNSCTGEDCYGTGLYVSEGDPELHDLMLLDNQCVATSSCYGTGGFVGRSAGSIEGMWVGGNHSDAELWVVGGGLLLGDGSILGAHNVEILSNTAEGYYVFGAGLGIYDYSDIALTNTIVAGNSGEAAAVFGAGIMANNGSTPVLSNVVVHGNTSESWQWAYASGVGVSGSSTAVLINTVVSSNRELGSGSTSSGGGIWASGVASLYYSDVYGNDLADFSGMSSPVGTNGNVSTDPGFSSVASSDPLAWDFTLDAASALVDAGDPSLFDPDGSTSDVGAYGGEGAADWGWTTSIAELHAGVIPEGYVVEIDGVVVTAVDATGFTVQDPAGGEHSGIGVYLGELPPVARGHELTLRATLGDFDNEARLQAVELSVTGAPGAPDPVELTLAEAQQDIWRDVLVHIIDGELDDPAYDCSADDPECDDAELWTLTDGSDSLIIYDRCYESDDWADQVGASPLTGVMTSRWGRYRLMPRSSWDS